MASALLKLSTQITNANAPDTKDHITPAAFNSAKAAKDAIADARPKVEDIMSKGSATPLMIKDMFKSVTDAIRMANKATKWLKDLMDNIEDEGDEDDEDA